jgi:hypothetical protein
MPRPCHVVTPKEASEILGVSENQFRKMAKEGTYPEAIVLEERDGKTHYKKTPLLPLARKLKKDTTGPKPVKNKSEAGTKADDGKSV